MQLGKYADLTITSGNISQDTIEDNEKNFLCFPYHYDMAEDSFIHLLAAGEFRLLSTCAFDVAFQFHYFHFLYIYEGMLDIIFNDEVYTVQSGHVLFFSPCDTLKYHILSGRCHFFQAGFAGHSLLTYRKLIPVNTDYPKAASGASCLIDSISHILNHVICHTPADTLMYSKWINDILTELCVYTLNPTRNREQIPSYMLEMKNLFNTKYQHPYSLEELEHYFQKSRYRLCREFSHYFGVSPIQYLNRRRIEAAKELLLSTSLTIHEVGSSVGIDNTNHFINLFKKETGATPLVFKQEAPVSISELRYPYKPDDHLQ